MTTDARPASSLEDTIAAIGPLDGAAVAAARERQGALTKPSGSLGRLEDLSAQLGAVLALPVVAAAARVLRDMATFDSAGVSGEK